MSAREELTKRYRAYCDVCQAGQLDRLKDFWLLPSLFTVDLDDGKAGHHLIHSYEELQMLYSAEFGDSHVIDTTEIDEERVTLYGSDAATIETSLTHLSNQVVRDTQRCFYAARLVDGKWMFEVHISIAKRVGRPAQGSS